jgi:hypothetical protein
MDCQSHAAGFAGDRSRIVRWRGLETRKFAWAGSDAAAEAAHERLVFFRYAPLPVSPIRIMKPRCHADDRKDDFNAQKSGLFHCPAVLTGSGKVIRFVVVSFSRYMILDDSSVSASNVSTVELP